MAYDQPFQRQLEYLRYYAEAVLTEDGPYLKDNVPPEYEGTVELNLEVCYAIFFIDTAGRLVLQTYNPPNLKNIDGESGMPITTPDGATVREGIGTPIQLLQRSNEYLPDAIQQKGAKMLEAYTRILGEWRL